MVVIKTYYTMYTSNTTQTFTEVGGGGGRVARGLTRRTPLASKLSDPLLIASLGTYPTLWAFGPARMVKRPFRTRDCNHGK